MRRLDAQYVAVVPGALILLIGLAHFFMPSIGYATADLLDIPEPQRSHFVYLGTYAIGVFLLAMGGLTIYFAFQTPSRDSAIFFGVMAAVWTARLVMELIYPVNLKLFFLHNPHQVLRFVIGIIALGYCFVAANLAARAVKMKRL